MNIFLISLHRISTGRFNLLDYATENAENADIFCDNKDTRPVLLSDR